jgi:hypothetical protein
VLRPRALAAANMIMSAPSVATPDVRISDSNLSHYGSYFNHGATNGTPNMTGLDLLRKAA